MAQDQKSNYYSGTGLNAAALGTLSTPPETFMTPMSRAEGLLDELSLRVATLADRLAGPMIPYEKADKPSLDIVPNGVFDDIAQVGGRMHAKTSNILETLARIEQRLP